MRTHPAFHSPPPPLHFARRTRTPGSRQGAAPRVHGRRVAALMLLAAAVLLSSSCATTGNSPISQAIAERLKGSVIAGPVVGAVGGIGTRTMALASSPVTVAPIPFGGFFTAPLVHLNDQEVGQ